MTDPRPERTENGRLIVPTYIQAETDYSSPDRATIKPQTIDELLTMAMQE